VFGLVKIALRNVLRSPLRAVMTAAAVAVTLVAFLLLRTLSANWTDRVEQTPNNRVVTRHKLGWGQGMPVHYAQAIRGFAGVKYAMGGRWAAVKHPVNDGTWFEATAVEAEPFIAMHYELSAPAEQKRAFVANRRGALITAELAQQYGWKVGDVIHLKGTEFPGDWEFHVSGICRSTRHGFAKRALWVHYEYYNERMPPAERDLINLVSAEIHDPNEGANIAKAIDTHFDQSDHQTYSQEDRAVNASIVGRFGAVLSAMDFVSLLVLSVILLLVGNAMAMNVRERTQEYGILRAIGFQRSHIIGFVLIEALLLGLAGGALGLAAAYPVVERAISRYLETNMNFWPLHMPLWAVIGAPMLSALLGLAAAAIPAYRASKLEVVEALRHVG
jgi:putative ABC transport system permease protein